MTSIKLIVYLRHFWVTSIKLLVHLRHFWVTNIKTLVYPWHFLLTTIKLVYLRHLSQVLKHSFVYDTSYWVSDIIPRLGHAGDRRDRVRTPDHSIMVGSVFELCGAHTSWGQWWFIGATTMNVLYSYKTHLIISSSLSSSCFCLIMTDSMICLSSKVKWDKSGIRSVLVWAILITIPSVTHMLDADWLIS